MAPESQQKPLSSDATSWVSRMPKTSYDLSDCIWKPVIIKCNDDMGIIDALYEVSAGLSIMCIIFLLMYKWKLHLRKITYLKSYDNFYNFIFAILLRLIIPKLCHLAIPYMYAKRKYINSETCAMVENFVVIFEIETLTHVCIERYVVVKYIFNGWAIKSGHYILYFVMSAGFSLLYSVAPAFGFGKYAKDFDCVQCTFDMNLIEDSDRLSPRDVAVLLIFVLKSIKPVAFMLVMLSLAKKKHNKLNVEQVKLSDISFTNMVKSVVAVNLFCWMPIAMTRGYVLFSQIAYNEIYFPPGHVVLFALIFYEMSPMITTLVVLNANKEAEIKDRPAFEEHILEPVQDKKE